MNNWDKEISDLVNSGRSLVKSQDLAGIMYFRFELAAWRGWVMKRWSEFDQASAMSKWQYLQENEKASIAKAEAYVDTLDVTRYRHEAKEWLETINQLLNACASAIAVLTKERGEGNIDSPRL